MFCPTCDDLSHLITRYVSRYRSATTTKPQLVGFVQELQQQFETWEDMLLQDKFVDALTDRPAVDKGFFLDNVRKQLRLLGEAVDKSLPLSKQVRVESKGFQASFGALAYVDR